MSVLLALALVAAEPACAPGVYVSTDAGAPAALTETAADHRRVANLAGAMLLGPFGGGKMKVKTVLAGASATVKVRGPRPTFRFCLAVTEAVAGSGYVGGTAMTPADYKLVRFEQGGDDRSLALTAVGGFGGPKGQLGKSMVAVRTTQVAPGVYDIVPTADLPPGEYGFLRAVVAPTSARKKDATERVYDFAVVG